MRRPDEEDAKVSDRLDIARWQLEEAADAARRAEDVHEDAHLEWVAAIRAAGEAGWDADRIAKVAGLSVAAVRVVLRSKNRWGSLSVDAS